MDRFFFISILPATPEFSLVNAAVRVAAGVHCVSRRWMLISNAHDSQRSSNNRSNGSYCSWSRAAENLHSFQPGLYGSQILTFWWIFKHQRFGRHQKVIYSCSALGRKHLSMAMRITCNLVSFSFLLISFHAGDVHTVYTHLLSVACLPLKCMEHTVTIPWTGRNSPGGRVSFKPVGSIAPIWALCLRVKS